MCLKNSFVLNLQRPIAFIAQGLQRGSRSRRRHVYDRDRRSSSPLHR
jgi:hypothetical protein